MKFDHIFIFLTPFHIDAAKSVYQSELAQDSTLIIYHPRLNVQDLHAKKITLPELELKKNNLFMGNITSLKTKVKLLSEEVNRILSVYNFTDDVNLILGTDRDLFCQFFIQEVKKDFLSSKVILIDEGVGFYYRIRLKDQFLKLIYPFVSHIFLGYRLKHIRPLGSHSLVDIVYLRNMDLLPQRQKNISYRNFNLTRKVIPLNHLKGKENILLYSFPDQDYNIGTNFKEQFLQTLSALIKEAGFCLTIKPHPREDVSSLLGLAENNDTVTILDGKVTGESLPFEEFNFIIHFKSSVIFELLNQKYPAKNIIAFGMDDQPITHHFRKNSFNMHNFSSREFKDLLALK